MRITSELWVKAFLRRVMADGHFAAVVRHGDNTAGAIFVKVIRRDRMARVFGPAHSGFETRDGSRAFVALLDGAAVDEAQVDDALAREQRFDSDLWVIEVETPDGDPMLGDELKQA
jgi:hypothetical protein